MASSSAAMYLNTVIYLIYLIISKKLSKVDNDEYIYIFKSMVSTGSTMTKVL